MVLNNQRNEIAERTQQEEKEPKSDRHQNEHSLEGESTLTFHLRRLVRVLGHSLVQLHLHQFCFRDIRWRACAKGLRRFMSDLRSWWNYVEKRAPRLIDGQNVCG